MLPFKLVYHERYDLNLGPHVFPSEKIPVDLRNAVRRRHRRAGRFSAARSASDEDILRVHTADWVRKLKTGTLTASEVMNWKSHIQRSWSKRCGWPGGTILAGQCAVRDGFGANLSGGFHHAHRAWRRILRDSRRSCGIRKLQAMAGEKAIVVDTDVHQGNGTAAIFRNDSSIFTFLFIKKTTIRRTSRFKYRSQHGGRLTMMSTWVCLFTVQKALTNFGPKSFFTLGAPILTAKTNSADCHLRSGIEATRPQRFRRSQAAQNPVATTSPAAMRDASRTPFKSTSTRFGAQEVAGEYPQSSSMVSRTPRV